MEIDISSYVNESGFIDPKLSRLVRDGEFPGFQLKMHSDCSSDQAFAIEQLVDQYGVPEELYPTASFAGVWRVLNPISRVLRPKVLKGSQGGGYKLKSGEELFLDPDNVIKIANGMPGSQFGDPENIPQGIEVVDASVARRRATSNLYSYGTEYIPSDGSSKDQYVYWASIGQGGLLYLAGLDLKLRGDDANVKLYLGIPGREATDDFLQGLKDRCRGVEFEVTDKRYDYTKDDRYEDDFPLPLIGGIAACG
ncbi:hypothetical protein HOE04_04180 [archaeon]|jgi:hypothetical protein|nr:hypothetical protein [archaeon]